MYNEEDYLQLSGIQHYKFCRRQWALIHVEQQWAENIRTVEGTLMHERAHDSAISESRGDLQIIRGMRVQSATIGVSGECDVVEFHRESEGITIAGKDGLWSVYPVEYKRGAPKPENWDALQLCAQAMCLEEMLCCKIPRGALYYGQHRHRQEVEFLPELRDEVRSALEEMHQMFRKGYTPKGKRSKRCNACSLNELCLPALSKEKSVSAYLAAALEDSL